MLTDWARRLAGANTDDVAAVFGAGAVDQLAATARDARASFRATEAGVTATDPTMCPLVE